MIPSSHLKDYEKKFLYIYLITNHSNKLILKTASLTAQPHLTLNLIKDHPIFFPNDKFQQSISEFFDKVEETKSQAKTYYQQAEQLLLRELGLENYQPSEDNISIKDSNEIGTFSRMDAEFFQPKYDEIIGKIKEYE
ncbi:MAG: restriction endonuclease subunit S [bacterium]